MCNGRRFQADDLLGVMWDVLSLDPPTAAEALGYETFPLTSITDHSANTTPTN